MRLNELNLLAYGKFTDYELQFPRSEHDFHVIIGPNEAGKSTVRRAIRELLFGMERQIRLWASFTQERPEAEAVLESSADVLQFMRTKKQKSLSHCQENPSRWLPHRGAGQPHQGRLHHLHSLDHTALVKGGEGIVDPNSVSQCSSRLRLGWKSFGQCKMPSLSGPERDLPAAGRRTSTRRPRIVSADRAEGAQRGAGALEGLGAGE